MKTAQRPRRNKDRMSLLEFGECGDFHAWLNGVGKDAQQTQTCAECQFNTQSSQLFHMRETYQS